MEAAWHLPASLLEAEPESPPLLEGGLLPRSLERRRSNRIAVCCCCCCSGTLDSGSMLTGTSANRICRNE